MSEQVPYGQAAAQAVGEVQQDADQLGVDAGTASLALSADKPAPLPAEAEHDALMAEFKAMSERLASLEAEARQSKQQYAAAVAALGPPPVATYSRAIFDKLVSFRNAHPDLPGHFDAVIDAARPLASSAQQVIDGGGQVSQVISGLQAVVDAVDRFITKTHPRTAGKPIDFSALASDLEYAVDAASKAAALTS